MSISFLLLAAACVNAGTLRQLRDVSHLPLEYLPPVVLPPLPSRDYLPPVEQHAASLPHVLQPPRDYLPPVEEQTKLNNEYLPPVPVVEEEEQLAEEISTTEASTTTTTEEPTTTEALPTTTEESLPVETEAPVEVKTHEDIEQASGILEADGYHYRTPEIIPDLSPAAIPVLHALPAVDAYLPPLDDNAVPALEEDVVPVPTPHSDESAALLDDGYHYRAIRRLRF